MWWADVLLCWKGKRSWLMMLRTQICQVAPSKLAEGLLEHEQFHKHLDSQPNSRVKVPSELGLAEAAYEDVASYSVLDNTANNCSSTAEHTLSNEDRKLETSDIAGSTSNVEDFNGPRCEYTQFKHEGSPGNGRLSEDLVEMDGHRVMEIIT